MAKITVVGQAVVVTSGLKLEDIKTIEKYRPDALILKGGENNKEELFRIGTGAGSINQYGASFNEATRDDNKFAVITLTTDYSGDDIKGYVADQLGSAITNLKALEEKLPEVVESIKAERKAIMDGITLA